MSGAAALPGDVTRFLRADETVGASHHQEDDTSDAERWIVVTGKRILSVKRDESGTDDVVSSTSVVLGPQVLGVKFEERTVSSNPVALALAAVFGIVGGLVFIAGAASGAAAAGTGVGLILVLIGIAIFLAMQGDGDIEVQIERSGGDEVSFDLPEDATDVIEAVSEAAVAHADS
jgi:hypothetical protein